MLEFLLIMGTGGTIDTWGLCVILIYLLQNRKHWIDFFLLLLFKNIALFWHAVIKACRVQSSGVFPGSLSQEGIICFLSLPHRIGSPDLQFWKPVDSKVKPVRAFLPQGLLISSQQLLDLISQLDFTHISRLSLYLRRENLPSFHGLSFSSVPWLWAVHNPV